MSRLWGHEERPGWFASIFLALASSAVVGIGIWTYLNAEVWTPLQRYYWNEYLNTEMYEASQGEYWILDTVDHRGQRQLATDSNGCARRQAWAPAYSLLAITSGATGRRHRSSSRNRSLRKRADAPETRAIDLPRPVVTELSWPAWRGNSVIGSRRGWAIRRNFSRLAT